MYLTKCEVDLTNYYGRKGLSNATEMHRNVMQCFSKQAENLRATDDVQFRVVESKNGFVVYVYSATEVEPQNAKKVGFKVGEGSKDLTKLLSSFANGKKYLLNARLCPTKKVATEGKKNSRRVGITDKDARRAWFLRKSQYCGFAVISCEEMQKQETSISRKGEGFTMYAYDYQAVIEVVDFDLFKAAFVKGIGAEKAFGCGMLLLKPLES